VVAVISVERAAKAQAWAWASLVSLVRAGAKAPLFQMAKNSRRSAMAMPVLVMW
jgi:hypothetical protein